MKTKTRLRVQADAAPEGDLAEAIRSRFRHLGGVDLRLPAREPIREPPRAAA